MLLLAQQVVVCCGGRRAIEEWGDDGWRAEAISENCVLQYEQITHAAFPTLVTPHLPREGRPNLGPPLPRYRPRAWSSPASPPAWVLHPEWWTSHWIPWSSSCPREGETWARRADSMPQSPTRTNRDSCWKISISPSQLWQRTSLVGKKRLMLPVWGELVRCPFLCDNELFKYLPVYMTIMYYVQGAHFHSWLAYIVELGNIVCD